MGYLLIIVLCLSTLLLCGCRLLGFPETAYRTKCTVEDSETNCLEVMQVVRLIADRYGFQDRTEEERARVERYSERYSDTSPKSRGTRIVAHYYAAGSDKPSSDLQLTVYAFEGEGKVEANLLQMKQGKATKKYTEIQDRLVFEFKKRFGAGVDVNISEHWL